ncbi:MAG: M23 family metallopeptidase [Clostridia bacterium]|nr:M23 family metallopeptidase [Clostridia bacterium]
MKNKVLIVILAIIMVLPTVVAIVNYSLMQGGQADTHNTVGVTLVDFYENEHSFTREGGNDTMVDYFIKTIAGAEEISALPTSIEMGNFYTVTMITTVDSFGYKFYFTQKATDCFFVNGDGDAYKIKEEHAAEFLKGAYSASLFENGIAPAITLSGNAASPDSASWSFKNVDGEYVAYDTSAIVKDEKESINLEGGLAMSFAIEPDSFTVKITDKDSGETVFDDVYANIAGLSVSKEMNVSVEATAKWYEDATRNYYGEQTYKFDATFGAPAQFYAGVTSIQTGEFICVTGVNVNNPAEITFKSEPDINYSPVFFKDGNKVQALIPFNWNLETGDYALTFSYGGSTQQMNISVKARSNVFREKTLTFDKATVENFGTEAQRAAAESALREVAKKASEKRYFESGETLHYDDTDLTFVLGYGHTYTVSGTDTTFRNTGVDFRVAQGTDIAANLGGEVVYAGILDYSGFTVVIEHGYGLKSWYCHLGSTSVKEGDTVKKGDVIGTAGASGFTNVEGVHIGMTIYDVPVCTYAIWKNSYRPEGQKGIVMYEAE